MRFKSLILLLALVLLLLFVSCEEPEEDIIEPEEEIVPFSIDELQGEMVSRRIDVDYRTSNKNGTPNENFSFLFMPTLAGFGKKELSRNASYTTTVRGKQVNCSVRKEGDYVIVEGKSSTDDVYIYMKRKKNNTEYSYFEGIRVGAINEGGDLINEDIIYSYAPSITLSGNVCSCHLYTFGYEVDSSTLYTGNDVYLYKDNDFLGFAVILGLREDRAAVHTVDATDFAEFSKNNMDYIIANMVDEIDTTDPGGYYGSLLSYRKSNNYELESTIALFNGREEFSYIEREKHQLSEFADAAIALDSGWVLEI